MPLEGEAFLISAIMPTPLFSVLAARKAAAKPRRGLLAAATCAFKSARDSAARAAFTSSTLVATMHCSTEGMSE